MNAKLACAAVSIVVCLMGCGAETARTTSATAMNEVVSAPATTGSSAPEVVSNELALAPSAEATPVVVDLATLPPAPWSAAPIAASEAPRQLLSAWENAENRDSCRPLATRSLGRATGARARTSELSGGWLVEFDRPGLPGIDRQGNECDTCGRSVFGIAGTSMQPDALLGPDGDTLAPSYSDGSHAQVEVTDADGESVASVTFTVNGQDCVYEVWSLLGPDHLAELVDGLRFVEEPAVRGGALASADR
jgi:hypothetical protein